MVAWLVPGRHNFKHHEACNRWQETGRCTWILENEAFTKWRSDGGFLWLHGIGAYYFRMHLLFVIDKLLSREWQVYAHVSYHRNLSCRR